MSGSTYELADVKLSTGWTSARYLGYVGSTGTKHCIIKKRLFAIYSVPAAALFFLVAAMMDMDMNDG